MQRGFLRSTANDHRADADWKKLPDALGNTFFEQAAEQVPTLINDPPKLLSFETARRRLALGHR
jgi:hypothetical protein